MADSSNPFYGELQAALMPVTRAIERLEDRTRDLVTRVDLNELRKEVVTRDLLSAELTALRTQIARNTSDISDLKKETIERIDQIETRQMSKQELLAMRASSIGTIAAFLLALFDFLTHARLTP